MRLLAGLCLEGHRLALGAVLITEALALVHLWFLQAARGVCRPDLWHHADDLIFRYLTGCSRCTRDQCQSCSFGLSRSNLDTFTFQGVLQQVQVIVTMAQHWGGWKRHCGLELSISLWLPVLAPHATNLAS